MTAIKLSYRRQLSFVEVSQPTMPDVGDFIDGCDLTQE
ncbi:minor head protein [Salmonella phage 21]|nr:minor head protein [Salmonella phage 21]